MPLIALAVMGAAVYVFFRALACMLKNIVKGKPYSHWLDGLDGDSDQDS